MRVLCVFIGILMSCAVMAQNDYQFGLLPSVNVNKSLPKDWKMNVKVESRQELKGGNFNDSNEFEYNYILTDVSGLIAKKVDIDKSVAGGYLIRFREGDIFHRTIQQFIVVREYASFKLAHRFASDQTFQAKRNSVFRLRYRLAASIPLNGQSVDPKEFYIKLNHEYLNAWNRGDYDLELRAMPHLGYTFSKTNKLELGLDYRLSSFLNASPSHRFWTVINWYVSL